MTEESNNCERSTECLSPIPCGDGQCERVIANESHIQEAQQVFLDLEKAASQRSHEDTESNGVIIDRPYFHITLRSG